MSEGQIVYALCSGAYSDRSTHCIFARLEDLLAYAELSGHKMACDRYGNWHEEADPGWGWDVEELQFWPPGAVPHAGSR